MSEHQYRRAGPNARLRALPYRIPLRDAECIAKILEQDREKEIASARRSKQRPGSRVKAVPRKPNQKKENVSAGRQKKQPVARAESVPTKRHCGDNATSGTQ